MKRREALDVIDLLIEALRQHEKHLDWLTSRMEELVAALEDALKRMSRRPREEKP